MSVFVGNLRSAVTEAEIKALFATYGVVKQVTLVIDRETGRAQGFVVEMNTREEEDAAMAALDGSEFLDNILQLKPKQDNSGGGRGSHYYDRPRDGRSRLH